jgi:uncharacterized damage-inducible protein DinB
MSVPTLELTHRQAREMVEELADRLLRMYPEQIRACLAELTDEQIWWRPNAPANAIGNLVLHLCGNLRHYLGRGVAGTGYQRDRPAEFAERGPLSRDELLDRLDQAIADARSAIASLTDERLVAEAELGPESQPIGRLLVGVTTHFNGHVGQIIYAAKLLREGAFADELWRRVKDR